MSKKILLIDDDSSMIEMLRVRLEGDGFEIIQTDKALQAIDLVKEKRPDLIILDILMPGVLGSTVCSALKKDEELKNIPILILSAIEADGSKAKDIEQAEAVMLKPFDPQELIDTVQYLLKHAQV